MDVHSPTQLSVDAASQIGKDTNLLTPPERDGDGVTELEAYGQAAIKRLTEKFAVSLHVMGVQMDEILPHGSVSSAGFSSQIRSDSHGSHTAICGTL